MTGTPETIEWVRIENRGKCGGVSYYLYKEESQLL